MYILINSANEFVKDLNLSFSGIIPMIYSVGLSTFSPYHQLFHKARGFVTPSGHRSNHFVMDLDRLANLLIA